MCNNSAKGVWINLKLFVDLKNHNTSNNLLLIELLIELYMNY